MRRSEPRPNGKIQVTEEEERKSRRELVHGLLSEVKKRLKEQTTKVTLADFIRLTQLERELEEEEQPREIIVTWSEPAAKQSVER